jgi:dTDP-4-dehydrorhamnose 3,5-epimerase
MKVTKTDIPEVLIIEPSIFKDSRGYFFESYNEGKFNEHGITSKFVQDNQSKSSRGVVRGLHYQLNPYAQAKLIRVLQGKIYDVAVDIRKGSPTFGKWVGVELSCENKLQLLIPRGFAHGFSVLSETATILYKCDELYNAASERGILFNDDSLKIDWKLNLSEYIVSDKDMKQPKFENAEMNFIY